MPSLFFFFFFFNDTATTEIYTLSLHDALPICRTTAISRPARTAAARARRGPGTLRRPVSPCGGTTRRRRTPRACSRTPAASRSEEHTSELQSPCNLVCRLLLEKKKKKTQFLSSHLKN